jgi:hypothetical protein
MEIDSRSRNVDTGNRLGEKEFSLSQNSHQRRRSTAIPERSEELDNLSQTEVSPLFPRQMEGQQLKISRWMYRISGIGSTAA